MTARRLSGIDLRTDPAAGCFVKSETVQVRFAHIAGVIQSRVGPNHYAAGDALIEGSDGDCWSVARALFDRKYVPVADGTPGAPGPYVNVPSIIHARRYDEAFTIVRTSGDILTGKPGDWLLQYAPGDYGIAAAERFARVYRAASS